MAQKVVIPKGLVNPNETTIVEIPKNLQNVGTVVARPRYGYAPSPPATPKSKTPPKPRTWPRKAAGGKEYLYDAGTTFGGRPFDPDETPPRKIKPWYPKDPADQYMSHLSPGDVSYRVGKAPYYEETGRFDPHVPPLSSTLREIDDSPERFLYRDFRPQGRSSRPSTPAGGTPPSMKHWHSSLGTMSPDEPSETSYYKSEYTTSTPEEISTEITEERSYYDHGDKSRSSEECPCSDESSGAYQRYDSSGSGGYQAYNSLDLSTGSGGLSGRQVMNSLGQLESAEMSQIMGDLNEFQNARRRLVFDASSLASAADFSSSLLESSHGSP